MKNEIGMLYFGSVLFYLMAYEYSILRIRQTARHYEWLLKKSRRQHNIKESVSVKHMLLYWFKGSIPIYNLYKGITALIAIRSYRNMLDAAWEESQPDPLESFLARYKSDKS